MVDDTVFIKSMEDLGYTVQGPKGRDKSYFMIKQLNKGSKVIYLDLKRDHLEYEVLLNKKPTTPTNTELKLINDLANALYN